MTDDDAVDLCRVVVPCFGKRVQHLGGIGDGVKTADLAGQIALSLGKLHFRLERNVACIRHQIRCIDGRVERRVQKNTDTDNSIGAAVIQHGIADTDVARQVHILLRRQCNLLQNGIIFDLPADRQKAAVVGDNRGFELRRDTVMIIVTTENVVASVNPDGCKRCAVRARFIFAIQKRDLIIQIFLWITVECFNGESACFCIDRITNIVILNGVDVTIGIRPCRHRSALRKYAHRNHGHSQHDCKKQANNFLEYVHVVSFLAQSMQNDDLH